MRILRIHDVIRPLGGAERYVLRTTEEFQQRGHVVSLVSPDDDPDRLVRPGHEDQVLPRARGFRTSRKAARVLLDHVDRFRPDIAIVHNTVGFLTGQVIGALREAVPTVKHIHDARVFCPRTLSKILPSADPDGLPRICEYKAGATCLATGCITADRHGPQDVGPWTEQARETWIRLRSLAEVRHLPAVFVDSEYMAREAGRNGVPSERIHVLGQIALNEPSGENVPAARPRITAIGRWDEAKGFGPLLELLLDLARAHTFEVHMVGAGPGLESGRAQVASAGLEDRIHIRRGLDREALGQLYRHSDLVVVPTCVPESFGIVGLEAHAHGLPVVAFDMGGVGDWLIDGETGLSVTPGDWAAFGDAIVQLCNEVETRNRLGAAGRQRRLEVFGTAAHVDRALALLEDISRN